MKPGEAGVQVLTVLSREPSLSLEEKLIPQVSAVQFCRSEWASWSEPQRGFATVSRVRQSGTVSRLVKPPLER